MGRFDMPIPRPLWGCFGALVGAFFGGVVGFFNGISIGHLIGKPGEKKYFASEFIWNMATTSMVYGLILGACLFGARWKSLRIAALFIIIVWMVTTVVLIGVAP